MNSSPITRRKKTLLHVCCVWNIAVCLLTLNATLYSPLQRYEFRPRVYCELVVAPAPQTVIANYAPQDNVFFLPIKAAPILPDCAGVYAALLTEYNARIKHQFHRALNVNVSFQPTLKIRRKSNIMHQSSEDDLSHTC